jgi:hypothetical protein
VPRLDGGEWMEIDGTRTKDAAPILCEFLDLYLLKVLSFLDSSVSNPTTQGTPTEVEGSVPFTPSLRYLVYVIKDKEHFQ